MALDTFENLKTSVSDYLDRPDLADRIPDFITLAEARHRRDFRTQDMLTRSQVTFSGQADSYLALPPRFLQMQMLRLLTDPPSPLEHLTPDQITRAKSGHLAATYGQPRAYTIHEEIEFDVVPDKDYKVEMLYYASFLPLSTANPSNALLLKSPDVYLYGTLVAAEPFMMNDARIQVWAELYKSALEAIVNRNRRAKQGSPMRARVYGGTP
jgi:hypothetical protein